MHISPDEALHTLPKLQAQVLRWYFDRAVRYHMASSGNTLAILLLILDHSLQSAAIDSSVMKLIEMALLRVEYLGQEAGWLTWYLAYARYD